MESVEWICRHCEQPGAIEGIGGTCNHCGGVLEASYPYEAIDHATIGSGSDQSQWRFDALLPIDRERGVSLGEGTTPLLETPDLAEELGVDRVLVKDEGHNPTGSIEDRALSVTYSMASAETPLAIASPGDAGVAAAAYGARAGVETHVYLPTRAPFASKAMVNVHGADMTVVGGRLEDAEAAARSTAEEEGWSLISAGRSPGLVEGAKTVGFELLESLDWRAPDAIVCPTGTGTSVVGIARAMATCRQLGLIASRPRLYAAQAAGCAPIVDAIEGEADPPPTVAAPDTICGELEVPDPPEGSRVLEVLHESGGGAIATEDPAVLDSATAIAAGTGIDWSPSAAAAASGAWALAEQDELDSDDTVVLVNAGGAARSADVLRSHLMGQGI